ncbi:MAG: cell division protein ZipA [Lysobacteraceae bacterium]|nr:MAG: cell division protein ZipA [Xanthomonadaceae bacterium]
MPELRWILLLVGALIVAGVYFFGKRSRSVNPGAAGQQRIDPVVDGEVDVPADDGLRKELKRLESLIVRDNDPVGSEIDLRDDPGTPERPPTDPDRVVVLNVEARAGELFTGLKMAEALDKTGVEFGDMSIYHRRQDVGGNKRVLFSVANMTRPGIFDPDAMAGFQSPGLTLFMTLPAPLSALDTWDVMLPAAQRLGELLDGRVTDDRHSVLSRQRIASIREEMREYDRKQAVRTVR